MPAEEASTFKFICCSIWKPDSSIFWVKIGLALDRSKMSFPPLFPPSSHKCEVTVNAKLSKSLTFAKKRSSELEHTCRHYLEYFQYDNKALSKVPYISLYFKFQMETLIARSPLCVLVGRYLRSD